MTTHVTETINVADDRIDKEFVISEESEMTVELLDKLIMRHKNNVLHYKRLKDMYETWYPIMLKPKKENSYKPDNRLAVNFAKYIVDTFNGYFIGNPIKATHEDKKVNDYLDFLDSYNNQDDNNAELSKICSIYGHGFELIFNDENGRIGLTYLNPMQAFLVFDESIRRKVLYCVRYYKNSDGKIEGTFSDNRNITHFMYTDDGLKFISQEEHYFNDVPVVEYVENAERKGIFESVESLINAFNKSISEKANDVDYYADAYMKILGEKLDEDVIKNLRDYRIINVSGENSEKVVVDFLAKPNSDTTQENLLDRLERLIFQISMVANISDENFAQSTGVSLKYKLQAMDNLARTKERKFTAGLNRRYKIIANYPGSPLSDDDWVKIRYKFTRNVPSNLLEETEIARNLSGIVSEETQVNVLSIVDNAKDEIENKRKDIEGSDGFMRVVDEEPKPV